MITGYFLQERESTWRKTRCDDCETRYPQLKRNIKAWAREGITLKSELDAVNLPSAGAISGLPHARGCAGSIVERQAIRREHIEERIQAVALDIRDARLLIWRLDNALEALNDFDGVLLRCHYIDGKAWILVADKFGYSEAVIKVYGQRALKKLARLLVRPTSDAKT